MTTLSVYEANALNLIASRPLSSLVPQLLDKLTGETRLIGELIVNPGYPVPPEFDSVSNDLRAVAYEIKQRISPGLKDFEVLIRYVGYSGYAVKARNEDEAERLARDLYEAGEVSHTLASDTEEITRLTVGPLHFPTENP